MRLGEIINPWSRNYGLLVEIVGERTESHPQSLDNPRRFLKVKNGKGRVFWTRDFHIEEKGK